jgi:2-keto-3-deoxy-L-rhamnonate aldolase RhmA
MATSGAAPVNNPLMQRMQAGDVALGLPVRLSRSGDIARIAKSSGHDFIFLDVQHSIFSLETLGHIAQTALGCGVSPIARVRSVDDPDVPLLLDNGITGIVFPDVGTAEQARRGVDRAKFPPIGKRSVCGGYPHFDFRGVPLTEAVPALNRMATVVCMIETVEGLENIEAIASVEGIDVIHVGANDLLTSMGKPGKFGDPEIVAAIERVIEVATSKGKFAGVGGDRNVERQVQFIRKGARFLTTQTDIGLLMAAASQLTSELRKALGK